MYIDYHAAVKYFIAIGDSWVEHIMVDDIKIAKYMRESKKRMLT